MTTGKEIIIIIITAAAVFLVGWSDGIVICNRKRARPLPSIFLPLFPICFWWSVASAIDGSLSSQRAIHNKKKKKKIVTVVI